MKQMQVWPTESRNCHVLYDLATSNRYLYVYLVSSDAIYGEASLQIFSPLFITEIPIVIIFVRKAKVRLSPGDPLQNSNPKCVSNTIPIASNRVPIWKTHFRCQEMYNPNLSILSSGDTFVEKVLF